MRRLFLLLLCSPFLACGPPASDSGGGGGGGGAPATVEAAIDNYKDALCAAFTTCEDTVQSALVRQFFFELGGDRIILAYSDKSRCDAVLGSNAAKAMRALIDADRVTVDLDKAQGCFSAMRSSCELELQIEACREFLAPNQQLGEACGDPQECVSGVCSAASGQCGECVSPAAIGEACNEEVKCAQGGRCDNQSDQCVAETPKVATGQACESDLSSLEGNCENPMDLCVDDVCKTLGLAQAGEACGETTEKLCALGSICIDELCVSDPVAVGDTCQLPDGEDELKRSALCPMDSRCDTLTSSCVALASAGDDCSGNSECRDGSYCTPDNICGAAQGDDADCEADAECASGKCADGGCSAVVALDCE